MKASRARRAVPRRVRQRYAKSAGRNIAGTYFTNIPSSRVTTETAGRIAAEATRVCEHEYDEHRIVVTFTRELHHDQWVPEIRQRAEHLEAGARSSQKTPDEKRGHKARRHHKGLEEQQRRRNVADSAHHRHLELRPKHAVGSDFRFRSRGASRRPPAAGQAQCRQPPKRASGTDSHTARLRGSRGPYSSRCLARGAALPEATTG